MLTLFSFIAQYHQIFSEHSSATTLKIQSVKTLWVQYTLDNLSVIFRKQNMQNLLILFSFVSPTITQCLFNSHWLAVSACRPLLQGVTAFAHGCLFIHWATMWVKGSGIVMDSSSGGVKIKRKYTRLHT